MLMHTVIDLQILTCITPFCHESWDFKQTKKTEKKRSSFLIGHETGGKPDETLFVKKRFTAVSQ